MGFFDKLKKMFNKGSEKAKTPAAPAAPAKPTIYPVEQVKLEYTLSADFEVNDLGDGTVEVGTFIGFDCENLQIASEINGKRVRGIGKLFPEGYTEVKNIKISEGVEYIADEAFMEVENIQTVVLPESLQRIGERAFKGSGLTMIIVPDGVKNIGKACFAECMKLKRFSLPNDLEIIEEEMFDGCEEMSYGLLPEKLRVVKCCAFYNCGICAFAGCTLRFQNFSEGKYLEKLEDGAFAFAPFYGTVRLPSTLTYIGNGALEGGNGAWDGGDGKMLIVPATVTHLGSGVFCKSSWEEIYFEKGFSAPLKCGVFGDCYKLKAVHIPASVTEIDEDIFQGENVYNTHFSDVYNADGTRAYNRDGSLKYDLSEYITSHQIDDHFIIYCEPGSAAMKFAKENRIHCEPYKPLEQESTT